MILPGEDNSSYFETTPVTLLYEHVTETFFNETLAPTEVYHLKHGVKWYNFIANGAVILFGMICNILSIIVLFSSKALRRTTTGHYLIALMFADTSFLLGEFLRWLNTQIDYEFILGIDFMFNSNLACKFTYYVRYSAKLMSAWITVTITVERFLTITMPLRVGLISTPRKAKVIVVGIIMICLLLASYPLWTVGVTTFYGQRYCLIIHAHYAMWNMVILWFGTLFVPSIIIFSLTIAILITLSRADKRRRAMGTVDVGRGVQRQLTAMLLAVAVAFLVLRIPYAIFWYVNLKRDQLGLSLHQQAILEGTKHVCEVFATANYATNFFLFCLCGSSFREQLINLFRRGGRTQQAVTKTNVSPLSASGSSTNCKLQTEEVREHFLHKNNRLTPILRTERGETDRRPSVRGDTHFFTSI